MADIISLSSNFKNNYGSTIQTILASLINLILQLMRYDSQAKLDYEVEKIEYVQFA